MAIAANHCKRCHARVTTNSVRCFACGARVTRSAIKKTNAIDLPAIVSKNKKAVTSWLVEPPDKTVVKKKRLWKFDLNDMQKQILAAAATGVVIFVYGGEGRIEGEVKVGEERFYGNEAVDAVARLVEPGLLKNSDDDSFELTDDGACLAASLKRAAVDQVG